MADQTVQHNKNVVGEETLQHDKDVLRPLATEIAEIAELPHQEEIREKWRALNDLKRVKMWNSISKTSVQSASNRIVCGNGVIWR